MLTPTELERYRRFNPNRSLKRRAGVAIRFMPATSHARRNDFAIGHA